MLNRQQMRVWIWVELNARDQLSIKHVMGGIL